MRTTTTRTAAEPLLEGELVSINEHGMAVKGHQNAIGIAMNAANAANQVRIMTSDIEFFNPTIGQPIYLDNPTGVESQGARLWAEYDRQRAQRETATMPPHEILRMIEQGRSPLLPPVITYNLEREEIYEVQRNERHPIRRLRYSLLSCGYRMSIDDDHAHRRTVISFHKNPRNHAHDLAAYYRQQPLRETIRQREEIRYMPLYTSWSELARDFGAFGTSAADAGDAGDALRELARQVGLSPAPQPSPAPPPVKTSPPPPPALPHFTPKPRRISA